MKINNVSITKNAVDETENGKYQFEYIIADGILVRVHATITSLNENKEEVYVGTITCDHTHINCHLPSDCNKTGYFEDFDSFMIRIIADAKKYETDKIINNYTE